MLGLNENRKEALHDISKAELMRRMKAYYDVAVSNEELDGLSPWAYHKCRVLRCPGNAQTNCLRESDFVTKIWSLRLQTIRPAVGLRREERESLESCETGTLDSI